ncbi:MAG: alpha/beta hydrolase [Bacilli bacterium]|nr:alpha/beta hydrolase [Bacilli bacterium]
MIYEKIELAKEYPSLKHKAQLTVFCPDNFNEISINRKREAILICPGGAYQMVSQRESEPVALRFLGFDTCAFLLTYSIFPDTEYPYPMIEAFAALDFIHKHAEQYHVDESKIFLLGFSAGGHLASTIGAYKDSPLPKQLLGEETNSDFAGLLLGYPVIVMNKECEGTRTYINLVGRGPKKLEEFYSIEKHVTPSFPRTFIFGDKNDDAVPHQNAQALIDALKENGVECDEHTYEGTVHGFSLGDRSVYNDAFDLKTVENTKNWYIDALKFMRK